MRSWPLFLLAALCACAPALDDDDDDQGIYIGNPGVTTLRLGAIAGTEPDDQGFAAEVMELRSCDGEHADEVDLSDGYLDGEEFEVPSGPWCEATLHNVYVVMDAIEGEEPDERFLTLELEIPAIELSGLTTDGFEIVADGEYVLELGSPGWFDVDEVDFEGEDFVWIGPEENEELHAELVERMAGDTALWGDANGNTEVDDEERDAGPVANPDEPVEPEPDPADDDDDDGSGPACAGSASSVAGSAAVAWPASMALVVISLLTTTVRRRRSNPRSAP